MTAALIAQERKVYPPLLQIHIFKPYRQPIPPGEFPSSLHATSSSVWRDRRQNNPQPSCGNMHKSFNRHVAERHENTCRAHTGNGCLEGISDPLTADTDISGTSSPRATHRQHERSAAEQMMPNRVQTAFLLLTAQGFCRPRRFCLRIGTELCGRDTPSSAPHRQIQRPAYRSA